MIGANIIKAYREDHNGAKQLLHKGVNSSDRVVSRKVVKARNVCE